MLDSTVSVCLSKALGAPVGSIIAGDQTFIRNARLVRKRLGGWMRQAGFLAVAGRMALEENVDRLAQDHENARTLARLLDQIDGLDCPEVETQTNVVMVRVNREGHDAKSVCEWLAEAGFGTMVFAPGVLRFVTGMESVAGLTLITWSASYTYVSMNRSWSEGRDR